MIAMRTVFVVSLLLQSAVGFECMRLQPSKNFYNQFISMKKSFLDYEAPPPEKLSEKDEVLSALEQVMRYVCPTRDNNRIKELNEFSQDEISFKYAEDPYSRYQFFTAKKKARMISFSSILVELTCPLLYQNQKIFRGTIKKVDEIVDNWNTNGLKKNGPSRVFNPNKKQIEDLAKKLSGAINNVDCPSNGDLITIITEAIEEMKKIFKNLEAFEKLSGTDKPSIEFEDIKITENYACYYTQTLDYIVTSPLNIPSLQQLRSICTEPLYDSKNTVKYKPLFLLKVFYPVFKLHEQNQVHCQLSPDTIVAANRLINHFILIDFRDVALEKKLCFSQPLIEEEPAVSLMSLEESKNKDVRDLGQTLMKVSLEKATLKEFGFRYEGKEIKFDDGRSAEMFNKALGKRVTRIGKGFSSSNVADKEMLINDLLTVLIARMAHPDPSKRPSVKKALFFAFSMHSLLSVDTTNYQSALKGIEENFSKFMHNGDFELPIDQSWTQSVSQIILDIIQRKLKKPKDKGTVDVNEVELEPEANIQKPKVSKKIEGKAIFIPMDVEAKNSDLNGSEEKFPNPMDVEKWLRNEYGTEFRSITFSPVVLKEQPLKYYRTENWPSNSGLIDVEERPPHNDATEYWQDFHGVENGWNMMGEDYEKDLGRIPFTNRKKPEFESEENSTPKPEEKPVISIEGTSFLDIGQFPEREEPEAKLLI